MDGVAETRELYCKNLLAKGMPAHPIFTDRAGRVIGDVEYEFYPILTMATLNH